MPATPRPVFALRTLALAAALAGAGSAHAQEAGPDQPATSWGQGSWGLGVGVASLQKAYAGIGRSNKAIPMVQFENQYVRLLGPGLEVKLPRLAISDTQRLNVSLVGRFMDTAGYEADDAPILGGMSERKGGQWLGAKAEWKNSLTNITADWSRDVSGHSQGQKFSLGLARTWRVGPQVMLTPHAAARWQNTRYNDYYYGVRAGEARPGRAAYRATSGINGEVGLRAVYLLDRHHSVMLDATATRLASTIRNSPLVDRATENRLFLAYLYRF